ncbi:MAG TPA: hypothetical protein PKH07_16865, partial [bacterium]|nr:hypothetical protein [bacterium]
LSAEVADQFPNLYSPNGVAVDAASQNAVRMRVRMSAGDKVRVFYRRQGETTYAGYREATLTSNASFVNCWMDFSQDVSYTGTIDRFRVAPTGAPNGAKLELDFFRVLQPTYQFTWRWDFDEQGNSEFWTALKHITPLQVAGGILSATTTGDDSCLTSRAGLNLDASTRQWVIIRMKVSAGTYADLFYKAPAEGFSAAKRRRFDLTGNTDFATYTLDMSNAPGWSGTIDRLRLDPTVVSGATVEIDYVLVP